MADPVQMLIDAGAFPSSPFDALSRYHGVALGWHAPAAGEPAQAYVLRRFIPRAGDLRVAGSVAIASPDRPELLAARTLGDALLYWRVADANGVIDPFELTDTPGARVVVPLSSGR